MPFLFTKLEISDVVLVQATAFHDERGFFLEGYKRSDFIAADIHEEFVQDNYSRSAKGVLRGLHYQKHPFAQGKLVMVTRGEIYDVAVDLRQRSPTYARWVAAVLSSENRQMLYVPPGFAHGFCTLSEEADVVYKVTAEYAPDADRGVAWNDPEIGVAWPISDPILSAKDSSLPSLLEADVNFVFGED